MGTIRLMLNFKIIYSAKKTNKTKRNRHFFFNSAIYSAQSDFAQL